MLSIFVSPTKLTSSNSCHSLEFVFISLLLSYMLFISISFPANLFCVVFVCDTMTSRSRPYAHGPANDNMSLLQTPPPRCQNNGHCAPLPYDVRAYPSARNERSRQLDRGHYFIDPEGRPHPVPRFCIYRPDGSIVPLIALDELPPNVQIGLPDWRDSRWLQHMTVASPLPLYHFGRYDINTRAIPDERFYPRRSSVDHNNVPIPTAPVTMTSQQIHRSMMLRRSSSNLSRGRTMLQSPFVPPPQFGDPVVGADNGDDRMQVDYPSLETTLPNEASQPTVNMPPRPSTGARSRRRRRQPRATSSSQQSHQTTLFEPQLGDSNLYSQSSASSASNDVFHHTQYDIGYPPVQAGASNSAPPATPGDHSSWNTQGPSVTGTRRQSMGQ